METESRNLMRAVQMKLQRWGSLGEAPEYYELKNRDPFKPTVSHPLNRFGGNMGPYADAMLELKSVEYINASPIDNLGAGTPFVATMCPKRETFAHFWSMVWELGSRVIVNLTHERDRVGSGPYDKRERYWPPFDHESAKQSLHWPVCPYTIGTEVCEQVPSLIRYHIELRGPLQDGVNGTDCEQRRPRRNVLLYWYSRWVDFPSSQSIGSRPFYANAWAVLHIALHLADQISLLGPAHWTICHCSAGVGRTGTLLALLDILRKLPDLVTEADLDYAIMHTIEAMREKRLWMVKTDIEFATLYAALLLRLRNPDDPDFALSWSLEDGKCAPSFLTLQTEEHCSAGGKVFPGEEMPASGRTQVGETQAALQASANRGGDGETRCIKDAQLAEAVRARGESANSSLGSRGLRGSASLSLPAQTVIADAPCDPHQLVSRDDSRLANGSIDNEMEATLHPVRGLMQNHTPHASQQDLPMIHIASL